HHERAARGRGRPARHDEAAEGALRRVRRPPEPERGGRSRLHARASDLVCRPASVSVRMIRIMTLTIALSVVATSARAQGFSFTPSFGISQLYDSNVFYRPLGESDTMTRASSRVDIGLRSERQTFW